MLDFRIIVHPFLLGSTKEELIALSFTVAAVIVFSLVVANKEIRKRRSGDDK